MVAVAPRQTVLVAQLQAERFLLLNNAKGNFQFADSSSGGEALVSQLHSAAALVLLPQMLPAGITSGKHSPHSRQRRSQSANSLSMATA